MKKILFIIISTTMLGFLSYTEEINSATIIILGQPESIRFVNIEDESYLSWTDLNRLLPTLFSITSEDEISVNPVVLLGLFQSPIDRETINSDDVIESRIDGTFEGWDGDTVFKLINGQIWQQTQYSYTYHYAYRPEVLIYRSGSGYKMKVDGVNQEIGVKRIK